MKLYSFAACEFICPKLVSLIKNSATIIVEKESFQRVTSTLILKHLWLTFTCSKSTLETPEKGVKYVQT